MTVGIRELRENLRAYVDRARGGEVVVVTERGKPVARLVAPEETMWDRWVREGRITPAKRRRTPIRPEDRIRAHGGSLADWYLEQKRSGKL